MQKQKMDYKKLLGRIKECGYTQKTLASAIGMSQGQLCQKLKSVYGFKQTEMQSICDVLDISADSIGEYFFSPCG